MLVQILYHMSVIVARSGLNLNNRLAIVVMSRNIGSLSGPISCLLCTCRDLSLESSIFLPTMHNDYLRLSVLYFKHYCLSTAGAYSMIVRINVFVPDIFINSIIYRRTCSIVILVKN